MTESQSENLRGKPRASWLGKNLDAIARGFCCGALLSVAALAARRLWAPADETDTIYLVGAMGACSAIGILGWWIGGGVARRRPSSQAIEDALDARAAGERDIDALRLNPTLGARAAAWNALLDDRDLREQESVCFNAARAAESHEHDSEELTASFESISQGIFILDSRMAVTRCNGAGRVLLGIDEDNTSTQFADLVNDDTIIQAAREVVGGERRPDPIEIERAGDVDGEPSIVRVSFRPMRQSDRAAALVILDDVTQRRLAERSRDAFVASATHELRTPLTNIRLHVEEALDVEDPMVRSRALQSINHESRRLERTIADMLSVSEIEAGALSLRPAEVRLETVFEEMQAEFAPQARDKNIELKFDLPPKYPVARADRDKLVLAISNLIGNALKYTPNDGRVDVVVRADERELEVRVADTGIGIDEQDQARVFDRFFRAGDLRLESVPGSGLGLALAREVARLHGGDIDVESVLNQGSVFTLRVKIAPSETAAAA